MSHRPQKQRKKDQTEDFRHTAGKVIESWRTSSPRSMSREDVASQIKRSLSTIQRWEQGSIEPRLSDMIAMERIKPGLWKMLGSTLTPLSAAA